MVMYSAAMSWSWAMRLATLSSIALLCGAAGYRYDPPTTSSNSQPELPEAITEIMRSQQQPPYLAEVLEAGAEADSTSFQPDGMAGEDVTLVTTGSGQHVSFQKPIPVDAPRDLFSAPICRAPNKDRGVCHSAIGCFYRGGTFNSICAGDQGVCCIFKHSCNIETSERLVYYSNPSFPETDTGNLLCNFKVILAEDMCAIRVEYLNYSTPILASCSDTQLVYLVGNRERTQPVCGRLSGHSVTIPITPEEGPLVISHVLGGDAPYLFNMRFTQIRCSAKEEPLVGQDEDCGRKNEGMVRHRRTARHGQEWSFSDAARVRAAFTEDEEARFRSAESDTDTTEFNISGQDPVSPWDTLPYSVLQQFDVTGNFSSEPTALTRILGGSETNIGEWPWQIAMLKRKNLTSKSIRFFCGGVLLTDEYVVTAAHCVHGQKSFNYTRLGKHLIISLGDHDLRTTKETKATFRSVREIMIHYAYDPNLNRNDIAIVRLSSPVEFSRSLSPACLPREYRDLAGKDITITGFGVTSFNGSRPGPVSPVLKGVTNEAVARMECGELWKRFDSPRTIYPEFGPVDERKICVGTNPGAACFGDSGGPATFREKNGRYTLVGVTSYGPPICTIGGLPTIYTRISAYLDWIKFSIFHVFSSGR